jgi:DNA helicase-2/ATP-dependent DNA helicase PcrA
MKERMASLVRNSMLDSLVVGTFHSFCYRILLREWQAIGSRVYEPAQEGWCRWKIKDILSDMRWSMDISSAVMFISWQKNNMIMPEDRLDLRKDSPALEPRFQELYRRYEAIKNREGKLDFDDMLIWCCQLLQDNAIVRRRYQNLFKYIMVDEFQDTNVVQYQILKLLSATHKNVFVVGDARQSVYGWRAARVEFILNFAETWPGARIIILKTNYRSSKNIVDMSNRLISYGSIRYPGECSAAQGLLLEPIQVYSDNEDSEADYAIDEIKRLCQDGAEYQDFACLYRVNAQSRALEDSLIRNEIPYTILGSSGFYGRKEVKDIIAYLRISVNSNDDESITRIMNAPLRYMSKAFLESAKEYACEHKIPLLEAMGRCPETKRRKNRGVQDLISCIIRLRKLDCTPAEMIVHARKITKYDQWLAETEGAEDSADNYRLENLTALVIAASRFTKLDDFLFYAEQAALKPANPGIGNSQVKLMTFHRAKGLEFPVVFLAGLSQGLLPHQKSFVYDNGELIPESIEEERRLCYVGMTRARERLYLSSIAEYQGKKIQKSVFLREIMLSAREPELTIVQ